MRWCPVLLACLALGLMAGGSALHAAPDGAGPTAPVQEAYRLEELSLADGKANQPPWAAAHRDGLLSPGLAALFAADDRFEEESQGVGNLDWDPFINGQDGEVKGLVLHAAEAADGKARVTATFMSLKAKQSVDFNLVLDKGRWLIDDILPLSEGKKVSIRAILATPYPCGSTTKTPC